MGFLLLSYSVNKCFKTIAEQVVKTKILTVKVFPFGMGHGDPMPSGRWDIGRRDNWAIG